MADFFVVSRSRTFSSILGPMASDVILLSTASINSRVALDLSFRSRCGLLIILEFVSRLFWTVRSTSILSPCINYDEEMSPREAGPLTRTSFRGAQTIRCFPRKLETEALCFFLTIAMDRTPRTLKLAPHTS